MAVLYEQVYYFLLIFFFLCNLVVNSHNDHVCNPTQSFALLEFKNAFSLGMPSRFCFTETYPRTTTWNESTDCCSWDGVECDDKGEGHVVGLHLGCSLIYGTLHHNNTLFTLSHLQTLNLSYNNFSASPFSPQFGMLTNLRVLDLSHSSFQGHVPLQISHLSKLVSLYLFSNDLTFSNMVVNQLVHNLTNLRDLGLGFTNLPNITLTSFMNVSLSLVSLDLSSCELSGPIPSWIYSLPNLKSLVLSFNNFSGFMRDFRSNSLVYIDLSYNNLQGEISKSIYRQVNLSGLQLRSNNLSGVLNLDMLGIIPSLYWLDISNNRQLSIFSTRFSPANLYSIDMRSIKLEKIPYILRNQKNLVQLDLSNNQIVGKIPEWFSELGGLNYLNLSHNFLSSRLEVLLTMPHLDTLILNSNNFSGVIPIPPKIQYYIASENQFIGEIPHSICLALNLEILSLSNNCMSGTIPPCLTNITSLSVLDLQSNNFSGTIPTFFSTGCQLSRLDLNDNQIEGELPQSLLYCKDLQVLDLGNNIITGNFPYWLKVFSSLRVLILRSNRFYGHINNFFNNDSFSNLRIIDLSHNNFSGRLPSSFFKNLRAIKEVENQKSNSFHEYRVGPYYQDSIMISLKGFERKLEKIILSISKTIDLSSNDFNGEIPKEIGMLWSLVGLKLSHNKLTGGIPTSLSNLNNLEWLDLSSNQLFGNIPPQLVALTFLSYLNLSQNQLSGPIPKGKQFDTFGNSSYFGNLGLCGFPLTKCDVDQKDHKSQQLHEEEEEEGVRLKKGIWMKAVFMGYGCGMVFGIFIGYLVLQCGKPVWIAAIVEGKTAQKIHTSRRNSRHRKRNI